MAEDRFDHVTLVEGPDAGMGDGETAGPREGMHDSYKPEST